MAEPKDQALPAAIKMHSSTAFTGNAIEERRSLQDLFKTISEAIQSIDDKEPSRK